MNCKGMSLYEFKRDPHSKVMRLYEFSRDPYYRSLRPAPAVAWARGNASLLASAMAVADTSPTVRRRWVTVACCHLKQKGHMRPIKTLLPQLEGVETMQKVLGPGKRQEQRRQPLAQRVLGGFVLKVLFKVENLGSHDRIPRRFHGPDLQWH